MSNPLIDCLNFCCDKDSPIRTFGSGLCNILSACGRGVRVRLASSKFFKLCCSCCCSSTEENNENDQNNTSSPQGKEMGRHPENNSMSEPNIPEGNGSVEQRQMRFSEFPRNGNFPDLSYVQSNYRVENATSIETSQFDIETGVEEPPSSKFAARWA